MAEETTEKTRATYPTEHWHERIADAVIHALSLIGVTCACAFLLMGVALHIDPGLMWASIVYCGAVFSSFLISAGYHLLPFHHWRKTLRRLDHVAIYALIAGTFTPLLAHIGTYWAWVVLLMIWGLAVPAMIYKLFGSNIEPRWSLASYLALGWLGVLAIPDLGTHLPYGAIAAIFIGGTIYTAGTYFYIRKGQAYRNAIWHTFVLAGTSCLFFAIWTTVLTDISAAG